MSLETAARLVRLAPILAASLLVPPDPALAQAGPALTITQGPRDRGFERNFNPFRDEALWPTAAGIYEPLLVFNRATSQYAPWLAESFEWSADNRHLRFKLRDGVRWSDGEPMDAEDVVFTFELMKRVPALDLRGVWGFLESVSASGPGAVEFRFSRLFTPGLLEIGEQPIVPEHRWRSVSNPASFANPNPVATGPFTEVLRFESRAYELGRNDDYWQQGKPAVAAIRVRTFPDNDAIIRALGAGELDWATLFLEDVQANWVAADPANHQYWYPDLGPTVLLHPNPDRGPLGDPRVRKALSRAIDRQRITDEALSGYASPADATGLADSQKRWKDETLLGAGDWTRRDIAEAGRLLDAAGAPREGNGTRKLADGTPLRYELNVVDGWSDWVAAAGIIRDNLAEVGVEVTVKPLGYQAWVDAFEAGRYDLGIWYAERGPTPYQFYGEQLAGTRGSAQLLRSFEETSDPGQLLGLSHRLQRLYVDAAPSLPLFASPLWGVYSLERFTGFPSRFRPFGSATPAEADVLPVLVAIAPR